MARRDEDLPSPEEVENEEAYLRSLTDNVKKRKSIVITRPPKHLLAKKEKEREKEEDQGPLPLVPPPPSARVREGKPASPAPGRAAATPQGSPKLPETAPVDGTFPVGSILLFEDKSVAVFKDAKPDKEYEVVYLLRGDGSIKPQGVALSAYDIRPLGRLPEDVLNAMSERKSWNRDEIVFHLDKYDYCDLIAHPDTSQFDPMATSRLSGAFRKVVAEKKKEGKDLVRGRKLVINFGPTQRWDAVYWGEDELGHVVAHHTHNKWALMHLDLKRFKDSLIWGEAAPEETVAEIHREIAE